MSAWLAAALARVASADAAESVPIAPIVPKTEERVGFGANGTIGTRHEEPPAAGTPFSEELQSLRATNPTNDDRRWRQACSDAGRFLRMWGEDAVALGWRTKDLFGLHPLAPLARYDAMGLVWVLMGRRVEALSANEAILEDGLRIRRSQSKPTATADQ